MDNQLYEVDNIQFGFYSAEEIRSMATFKVTTGKLSVKNKEEDEDEIFISETNKSKYGTGKSLKWVHLTPRFNAFSSFSGSPFCPVRLPGLRRIQ